MNKKYPGLNFQLFFILFYGFMLITYAVAAQKSDNEYKLKTVVIDAGHGGKDPGSLGKQTTEKEVALSIALRAGHYIEQEFPDVSVIYTRKTDEFVPLHLRAEIANSNKADLFISIHVNGNTNTLAYGTETLLIGLHRAGENFEVAKKENSVILLEDDYTTKYEGFDPSSPESYQMFSLMQEKYRERAMRKDRGLFQQGLLVLARTAMPGVLIETGFITNPEEETYLMSDQGQDYIASAIFRAFRDYKSIIESRNSFTMASRTEKLSTDADSMPESQETGDDSLEKASENVTVTVVLPKVEFKVQVAASSKPIAPGALVFKGLSGIAEYHVGKMYKYAVGSSPTFQEIIPLSKQIKELFPDAFVIAVKENKIIPLDQALKESQLTTNN
jgi:N-acetylmuramoyl-L-alanine amidase